MKIRFQCYQLGHTTAQRAVRLAIALALGVLIFQYVLFSLRTHLKLDVLYVNSSKTALSNEWVFETRDSTFLSVSGLSTDRFRGVDGVFRHGFIPVESISNIQFGFPLKWIETTTVGFPDNVKPFDDSDWKTSNLPRILPLECAVVFLFTFGVTLVLVIVVGWFHYRIRTRKGLCPHCGYCLSPLKQCTECGFGFKSN